MKANRPPRHRYRGYSDYLVRVEGHRWVIGQAVLRRRINTMWSFVCQRYGRWRPLGRSMLNILAVMYRFRTFPNLPISLPAPDTPPHPLAIDDSSRSTQSSPSVPLI